MGERLESLFWIKHPNGTRELDLGWAILVLCSLSGVTAFFIELLTDNDISNAGWAWFGSFTTFAFIAGASLSRARLIAKSGTVAGSVASGIAAAVRDAKQPDVRVDDERGEHTDREAA
jgi:hypothetical protein